jgi:hypothetical protein
MPANTPRGYTYPLYTDPANPPAQIQDFAQDVDLDVQAQVNLINGALNRPSARAIATANVSIAANTFTFLTFATEEYDNAAMINLGVNNDRLTFTSSGLYLISASVIFAPNGNVTTGGRGVTFVSSTAIPPEIASNSTQGSQTNHSDVNVTYTHWVPAAGEFIRLRVYQTSGAALNVNFRSISATKVAD